MSGDLAVLLSLVADCRNASAEVIAAVESAGRLIDAARIQAASRFIEPGAPEARGDGSAVTAVACLAQVSERTAQERLLIARAITPATSMTGAALEPAHPGVAAALVCGAIGFDAAVLVTRQLNSVVSRVDTEVIAAAEQIMVNLASGFDPTGVERMASVSVDFLAAELRQITAAIDPDGARPREERAIRRRSFRMGQQDEDGLFPLNGRILPEIAILLLGMIEATRRSPRFVEGPASGITADFDDSGAVDSGAVDSGAVDSAAVDSAGIDSRSTDSRSPDQLRHDALASILMAAAAAKDAPRLDGEPVTVVVTARARDINCGGRSGDPIGTMAGSRFPLSRSEVERFIDASGVRNVTENNAGAVLGISSTQRCFTNAQRLGIAARDGYRCATPGCTSSPFALQAHHVIPDRDDGPTVTDNGILLCYWHHKQVDTGPWQYRMVEGLPEVRGPGIRQWARLRPHYAKAA